MAVFTVRASQYVSGSRSSVKLAEFEIIICHHVAKKNLFERTRKAKLGSKISLVGELDVHDDKLYVELHNFDFISPNAIQHDTSPSSSCTTTSASEKRSRLYESLSQISSSTQSVKRHKVSDATSSNNKSEDASKSTQTTVACETLTDQPKIDHAAHQPSRRQKPSINRELRSSDNKKKKISDLASTSLDLPPFEEQ